MYTYERGLHCGYLKACKMAAAWLPFKGDNFENLNLKSE